MRTFIFEVKLFRKSAISREIEVKENTNLYKLAEVIVNAFDFNFDHSFGFFDKISEKDYFDSEQKYELFTDLVEEGQDLEPTGAGSVKETKIDEVWKQVGDKMMFLFDYGDSWQFIVELKEIDQEKTNKHYPLILGQKGKAPKQYS